MMWGYLHGILTLLFDSDVNNNWPTMGMHTELHSLFTTKVSCVLSNFDNTCLSLIQCSFTVNMFLIVKSTCIFAISTIIIEINVIVTSACRLR